MSGPRMSRLRRDAGARTSSFCGRVNDPDLTKVIFPVDAIGAGAYTPLIGAGRGSGAADDAPSDSAAGMAGRCRANCCFCLSVFGDPAGLVILAL